MQTTLWEAFAKLHTRERNALTEIWAENCHRFGRTYPFVDMLTEAADDAKTLEAATENLATTARSLIDTYRHANADGYEICHSCPTHCTVTP